MERLSSAVMFMVYLYSKLPEAGVACHIGTGGSRSQLEVLMSNNLNAVRGVYRAFAIGDIPAVLAVFSSNIHWTEAEGGPYGGVSIGPDVVLENVFMKLGGEWDGFAAVPSEFVEDGSIVVALGEYSGTFKATGKSFKAPFAHVWKFENGKAASFHQYTDTAVHQRPLQV